MLRSQKWRKIFTIAENKNQNTKTAKKRELQLIRSTTNPPFIRRSREIPVYDNCRFCRILLQVLVIFAKFISWYCCISSLYNYQPVGWMHKNAKLQMLRVARFSQFDGAQFWIVLFIVTAILSEIAWVVLLFVIKQCIRSFEPFCSFRNDICIFLILNPKKQTEQRFYESSGVQGFRLDLKVFKGRREHLHTKKYPSAFFLPLVFKNFSQSFIEYSTVTFEFDPCALVSIGYRKRAKMILFGACSDIKKWLLNW